MEQGSRSDSTVMSARQAAAEHTEARREQDFAPAIDRMLAGSGEAQEPAQLDRRALVAYASWLALERQHITRELYPNLGWKAATFVIGDNAGFDYHRHDTAPASSRALGVLAAVGCDWTRDSEDAAPYDRDDHPASVFFPHPDARLLDLEQAYHRAETASEERCQERDAAQATFDRQEEGHVEAERDLVMFPSRGDESFPLFWRAEGVRRVLMGGSYGGSQREFDIVAGTPRARLEVLLPRLEAREARHGALKAELDLEALNDARDAAVAEVNDIADRLYLAPAHTLDGLAIKARVLRVNHCDLWKRDRFHRPVHAEAHEVALTQIVDGIEHLLSVRGMPGGSAIRDVGQPDADPIYAVIAENRRLLTAWNASLALPTQPPHHDPHPDTLAAQDAFNTHTADALLRTVPRTTGGCKALARYARDLRAADSFVLDEDDYNHENWRILDLIARSPAAGRLQDPATDGPDPVFAAITEAWRLTREHGRLHALCADKDDDHPSWGPEREAHGAMWDYIRGTLIETVPTTAEGCKALARCALDLSKAQGVPLCGETESNDPVLDMIARSPAATGAAPDKAGATADAALLALAPKLLPMLDTMDVESRKTQVLHEASEEALGGCPDRDAIGHKAANAWIERWRNSSGYRTYMEACGPLNALSEAVEALVGPLMDVPALTLDGLLLKQRIGRTAEQYRDDAAHDLDKLLTTRLAAGAFGCAVAAPATSADADLYEAMAAHDGAQRAFETACEETDQDTARQETRLRADAAWRHLFTLRPRTPSGFLALLNHIARWREEYEEIEDAPDIFATLIASFEGLRAVDHGAEGQAIALIEAIKREWPLMAEAEAAFDGSPQQDAAYDVAYARHSALIDRAEALPATCREAGHAKALALAWLTFIDSHRIGRRREDYATDGRLALDIHAMMTGAR